LLASFGALTALYLLAPSTPAIAQQVLELEYEIDFSELEVPQGADEEVLRQNAVKQVVDTLIARLESIGTGEAQVSTTADHHVVVRIPVADDADVDIPSALAFDSELGFHVSRLEARDFFGALAHDTGLAWDVGPEQLTIPSAEQADRIIAEVTSGSVPSDLQIADDARLVRSRPDASGAVSLYLVDRESPLSADSITDVSMEEDAVTHRPYLSMTLDESGRDALCRLTETNVGRIIAIVFDDEVLIAPPVSSPICTGLVRIDLGPDIATEDRLKGLQDLVVGLREASLPHPLRLLESRLDSSP